VTYHIRKNTSYNYRKDWGWWENWD